MLNEKEHEWAKIFRRALIIFILKLIKNMDSDKQYLVSSIHKDMKIVMGNFNTYLTEAKPPVRSNKEPKPLS